MCKIFYILREYVIQNEFEKKKIELLFHFIVPWRWCDAIFKKKKQFK